MAIRQTTDQQEVEDLLQMVALVEDLVVLDRLVVVEQHLLCQEGVGEVKNCAKNKSRIKLFLRIRENSNVLPQRRFSLKLLL